nr:MAG TPA: hypothetical protein [Caudoviricetes sp.]
MSFFLRNFLRIIFLIISYEKFANRFYGFERWAWLWALDIGILMDIR